jgi:hypothetical protein
MKNTFLKTDSVFAILITCLFFIIGLQLVLHHEMWHDETCEWLIARDSPTFISLLNNYTQMTHPIAWVSLLWVLTKFTSNIFSMQLLNLILATLAVYIFLRYAPFSRTFKVLFSFGYFPLYEYGTISRDYALGMFILFIFAALYKKHWHNFLLFSFIVVLLANANIITFFFSIFIFIFLLFESGGFLKKNKHKKNKIIIYIGCLLMAIGIIFALTKILPYEKLISRSNPIIDVVKYEAFKNSLSFINMLFASFKIIFSLSFFPIPFPFLRFWQTHLFRLIPDLFMVLSILIFLFTLALFRRNIKFLILWIAIVSFFYLFGFVLIYRAAIRHFGFLYLFFIVCLWMYYPAESCKKVLFFNHPVANFRTRQFINIVLIIHIFGAGVAAIFDWVYPFTRAKEVANYIINNHLENKIIIGWRDDFMPSVIAYANLKKIYYPQGERFGSFVVFDAKREKPIMLDEIIKPVLTIQKKPEDFLFIFTPELSDNKSIYIISEDIIQFMPIENTHFNIDSSKYRFKRIAVFAPAVVLGESFALYELEKINYTY